MNGIRNITKTAGGFKIKNGKKLSKPKQKLMIHQNN